MISPEHLDMLAASGITAEFALARGYETINDRRRLDALKITKAGRNVPGLLIPLLRAEGSTWGYQYRPDAPRLRDGRPIKYETPWQQPNGLDIPPGVAGMLGDPSIPLFITEGVKKGDAGALGGLCIVDLIGVWNWLYTNTAGGKMALPEWRDCALNGRRVIIAFDSDMARNNQVQIAARGLANYLATKGARIEYLWLPDTDAKIGIDDYLVGHSVDELMRLIKPIQPTPISGIAGTEPQPEPSQPEPVQPITLQAAHDVFKKWLGENYDTDALDAVLAAIAVERLDGDPLWLLVISGPGNAKTETVMAASGTGAIITSSISSEGALISGTSARERTADATGGLLRKLGDRGVIVIKDVTTLLSMSRDDRAKVLAAMREVYDGYWSRNIGVDGGRTLEWKGRIAIIGAVTTAWDKAHAAISSMGDRFVSLRMDSTAHRVTAGYQAIGNIGDETQMRTELAAAVAGVIAGMNTDALPVADIDHGPLLAAADLVNAHQDGRRIRLPRQRRGCARARDADPVCQTTRPGGPWRCSYRHGSRRREAAGDSLRS